MSLVRNSVLVTFLSSIVLFEHASFLVPVVSFHSQDTNNVIVKGQTSSKISTTGFFVRGSGSSTINTIQRRKVQKDDTDDALTSCPQDYSLFHCEDPWSEEYDIPCDRDSCLWDLSKLNARVYPASCSGIRIEDPYAVNLPDIVKPCALWSIMYGEHQSQSPTASDWPTGVPTLPPITANVTQPAAAPVVTAPVLPPTPRGVTYLADEKAYLVSFDTLLINFFVTSSSLQTTTEVFTTKSDALAELTSITSLHIYAYLNTKLDVDTDLVKTVRTNYSSLSIQDPWNNGTILVSETLMGDVVIHEDYGVPRPSAIANMVKESFKDDRAIRNFLMDVKMSTDPTLREIHHLYVGLPSEVIDSTTTITGNDTTPNQPPTSSTSSSSTEKDGFAVEDFGKQIEWGDWSDTYFLVFVFVTVGVVAMLCAIFVLCFVLRRRVNKRQDADLLVQNKSSSTKDGSDDGLPSTAKENTENSETNTSASGLHAIPLITSTTHPIEDSNSKSSEDAAAVKQPEQSHHLISNRFNPISHQIVQMDDNGNDYDDIQSDVYSYIDTNTVDDHCYSVAGALRYNPNIPGDDDDNNNWSVTGGTLTGIGGNTLLNTSQSEDVHQTPQRTNASAVLSNTINLSGMISEESRNDNVVIFCDSNADDDMVSLINDSILHSTYDQTIEQQQHHDYSKRGNMLMSSKPTTINAAMSTNDRVAEVVAKLEGKTFSSNSFTSASTNATEKTTNKNGTVSDGNAPQSQPPVHHPSSGSRGDGTEGDPSSEGSVALSSYLAMPYQNDRQQQALIMQKKDESNPKPPMAQRSKSANIKNMKKNGQSVRAKPSFFRSTSSGKAATADSTVKSNSSWGIPTGESTNEKDIDNNETNAIQEDRKKGFWARTQANRSSKATQMVLGSVSSPSNSLPAANVATSPTQTYTSPVSASPTNYNDGNFLPVQQVKLFEQYEESESDIQSICSFDDRSYFSFVKAAKGNAQLTDQERGSLRPPVTGKNAYMPSMYNNY